MMVSYNTIDITTSNVLTPTVVILFILVSFWLMFNAEKVTGRE